MGNEWVVSQKMVTSGLAAMMSIPVFILDHFKFILACPTFKI